MTTGFIYVNTDLRHQYGISVAELQMFLLAKRPSAAMSEEKRLSFAGYTSGERQEVGRKGNKAKGKKIYK